MAVPQDTRLRRPTVVVTAGLVVVVVPLYSCAVAESTLTRVAVAWAEARDAPGSPSAAGRKYWQSAVSTHQSL